MWKLSFPCAVWEYCTSDIKPYHFVLLLLLESRTWKGAPVKAAQARSDSVTCVCVECVRTLLLSFKCFVAGREFERRMRDEL